MFATLQALQSYTVHIDPECLVQGSRGTPEVGGEALDPDAGLQALERTHSTCKVLRAPVSNVVPIDRRQHDVAHAPLRNRLHEEPPILQMLIRALQGVCSTEIAYTVGGETQHGIKHSN